MMPAGRCRLHGGASTGPTTPEGRARSAGSNLKDGRYTNEMIALRRAMAGLRRAARQAIEKV